MKTGKYTQGQVATLARRAYLEGRAGFEIKAEKSALLVVDMQEEYVQPGWSPYWVPEGTRIIPRTKVLIERCRRLEVPVIFTLMSSTARGLDHPAAFLEMPTHFGDMGLDLSPFFAEDKICPSLGPEEGDLVLRKAGYGAFYGTGLEAILRNLGRDTILLSGVLTNYAVGATARQGFERGFKVAVGSDVTATDDPTLHTAELMVLRRGFSRVLTAKGIIDSL